MKQKNSIPARERQTFPPFCRTKCRALLSFSVYLNHPPSKQIYHIKLSMLWTSIIQAAQQCYADSVMEFPDILLSVPPESLSKFPCSAVSGKLTTAAKRLTTANECRIRKRIMAFAAIDFLLTTPYMHCL